VRVEREHRRADGTAAHDEQSRVWMHRKGRQRRAAALGHVRPGDVDAHRAEHGCDAT
jgi:hypothetical protein